MQSSRLKALVIDGVAPDGTKTVTIPGSLFRQLLVTSLRATNFFDERYYLQANPDVQESLRKREIQSAAEHYYETGYFEGRMPKEILVDERFYLEQNSDVAEAIRRGIVDNAQKHFDAAGFREGRLPHKDFSLF